MQGWVIREGYLIPDTVACADEETCMEVCGSKVGCSNTAYPALVMEVLPIGKSDEINPRKINGQILKKRTFHFITMQLVYTVITFQKSTCLS